MRFNGLQIGVVTKTSKLDWDLHHHRLPLAELLEFYRDQGIDPDRIVSSHKRQLETYKLLRDMFGADCFIDRNALKRDDVDQLDVLLGGGGDNHATYMASYVRNKRTVVVMVNSDPQTSVGALTLYQAHEVERVTQAIVAGNHKVAEWQRVHVEVGGKCVGLVTSEAFFGEYYACAASRVVLTLGESGVRHTGSGLIVAPGAGTKGWFHGIRSYVDEVTGEAVYLGGEVERTALCVSYVLRETYGSSPTGKAKKLPLVGTFGPDEVLHVISQNDARGVVHIDPLEGPDCSFPLAEKATARLAPEWPLRVAIA